MLKKTKRKIKEEHKRRPTLKPKKFTKVIIRGREFDPTLFHNRDLSWLEFNARVLNEAMDPRTPLLERLRFCDIWRSNNDEFVMKRLGLIFNKIEEGDSRLTLDGKGPAELLQLLRTKVLEQIEKFCQNFEKSLVPELKKQGIEFLRWGDCNEDEQKFLTQYFKDNIFPILTPLAVDSGHPFPFLSNLSKSIGVAIRRPKAKSNDFARVKIPSEISQWVRLRAKEKIEYRFIHIEEIIIANLKHLFWGMKIEGTTIFRVTRNAASKGDLEEPEDLMELVEEGLRERKFAPIVRLEYAKESDPWVLNFLKDELELSDEQVFEMPNIASFVKLGALYEVQRPLLKYDKYVPRSITGFTHTGEAEFNIFAAIRKRDYLVHFPYDSFTSSVETFMRTAAHDPKVRAIKVVLYRTDADGKIVDTLIEAAENGKQVACIIELKARFDEERNIRWATKLEEAGVHVTYGLLDLKTHAKMIVVVRQDHDGIRSYVNIGTGNYNSETSKLYTDYSYFTCKKAIAQEVLEVFNHLTGRSIKSDYKKILVAPFTMFDHFLKLIKRETEHAKAGKPAQIMAKMNSLEDPEIVEALYAASKAGVKVLLFVRGFCALKAGVKGLSENIRVISIVGRFLEHSRIYYFSNGSEDPFAGNFYIGSADLMHRNLFDRIEVAAPITQKDIVLRLYDYLKLLESDDRHAWDQQSDGSYIQRMPKNPEAPHSVQNILMRRRYAK